MCDRDAAEMAYEIGTYRLQLRGPAQDEGKYLVVWKKAEGRWRVAADMFNSNRAPGS